MIQKRRGFKLACMLVALVCAGAAQGQTMFGLTNNSGGELQIGTGLPLPVGPAGIFTGGMVVGTAGVFPPLYIPKAAAAMSIMQIATARVERSTSRWASSATWPTDIPNNIGVFNTNPVVYQVATTLNYSWPNAAAVLAPGGAPVGAFRRSGGRHHHLRRRGRRIRRPGAVRDQRGSGRRVPSGYPPSLEWCRSQPCSSTWEV